MCVDPSNCDGNCSECVADRGPSLTDAMAVLGITHAPSKIEGSRDWFDKDGKPLGTFDAAHGWEMLAVINSMGNSIERALQRYRDEDEAAEREFRPSRSRP